MSPEQPAMIEVTINGESRVIAAGLNVTGLLVKLEIPPTRVAIEYNRRILKKELWDETSLADGDNLEIVHFVGGG